MKIKRPLLFISIVLLAACGRDTLPEGVLSKEQMIPVMVDVQIAEGSIAIGNLHGDSARQKIADYYNHIYERHQVSKEDFQKSLEYYTRHPKQMDQLYKEVLSELTRLEAEQGN